MRISLLSLLLLLFSWQSFAQYEYKDISSMLLKEKPYSKDELFMALEGKKITNVEEFIAALPQSIRQNYVLMYDSKSLQSASFQRPRVILRSPLSEVMLTFTDPQGSTNEHDSNVELMYWDKDKKAFEMQEITFTSEGHKLSKVNPESCIKCHGKDPRPNWEPYSTWPGVYGGDAEFRYGGELVKNERKNLDAFIKTAPKHPIYKNLVNLKENFRIEPSFTGGEEAKGLMSYKLTESLSKLNFQRIVRMMKENPNYEKFKYATLYMACPGEADDLSPFPDSLKELNKLISDRSGSSIIEVYQVLGTDTSKWSMSFRGTDKQIRFSSPDGQKQNLAYALLKEDKDLWPYFNKENPLDWKENTFWEYGENELLCEKLRLKSQEVLKGVTLEAVCSPEQIGTLPALAQDVENALNQKPVGNPENGKKLVHKNCIECHAGLITDLSFFADEKILKKHLSDNPDFVKKVTGRLQSETRSMPPGKKLPASEQADIIEYIKSFVQK